TVHPPQRHTGGRGERRDLAVLGGVGHPHVPDPPAPSGEQLAYRVAADNEFAAEPCHWRRRATAKQAMPSPRPNAPSPSARLPFTTTGAPTAARNCSCIASRCGARRGL